MASQSAGTKKSAATEETAIPKASETTMGTIGAALGLSVSINGMRPTNDVTVVMRIGRHLDAAASSRAASTVFPSAR